LLGVSAAAVLPSILIGGPASFGWVFVVLALAAGLAMRGMWRATGPSEMPPGLEAFRPALADSQARWLLVVALVNSMPVAVTSTLFLFFVEDRLELPSLSGPFLLLFFLSAAASAPVWSKVAARIGARRTLMIGMALAILAFLWAASLGPGAGVEFGVICVASGAALGADLVLLPALFARRLGDLGNEAAGFSLWALVSKLALALAAATVLPMLQALGFEPGAENMPEALSALSLTYAALPCALKAAALAILWRSPIGRD
jgi:GPH family glycoside/pentoside/hexuronide:cation symporter